LRVFIVLSLTVLPATKMKHLAAYLLLSLGGNTSPSVSDITAVLSSVGIEADEERLSSLISELKGKDLQEVCELSILQYKLFS
jgi:ribosomal protein L12E/L44/L45/RPP1/RPP2